jgi:predicted RNase H-like HicB family nuclease
MANKFTLEYWMDEGWFVGRLKEVPGVFSQGKTLAELKANIQEAYELMIKAEKEDLPVDIRNSVKEVKVAV